MLFDNQNKIDLLVYERLEQLKNQPIKGNRLGGNPFAELRPQAQPQMTQQVTSEMIKIDEAKPTTKIQFQMADGKKLVQTFNHDHTMSDLFLFAGAQNDFGFQFEVCEQTGFMSSI